MRLLYLPLFAVALAGAPALAQTGDLPPDLPPGVYEVAPRQLSGPRVGFTYLSPKLVDRINDELDSCYGYPDEPPCEEQISPGFPVVTQFGWQFERTLFQAESGLAGVTEIVPLVGGLERGLFLPSATFLVGVRTPSGVEFGLGPNLSAGGAAYAVAAGFTNDLGEFAVPVNVAAVFGEDGPRVSLLLGFAPSGRRVRRVQ